MRSLDLLGILFALSACSHAPAAPPAPLASPAPRALSPMEPRSLGAMRVWPLKDGELSFEASLLQGIDLAEAKAMLSEQDAAKTPVNAFLVQLNGKTVLVDSGMGREPGEDSGHLLEQLTAAGSSPSQVDLIVITHFHFDHVGGLLKPDGTRAFPNASLRVPRAEYEFWLGEPSALPERLKPRRPKLRALFSAYQAAGAFHPFEADEELSPGVRALAAYGHTGGHTVYSFSSGDQELWCIGDLIHFEAVQFERPEVAVSFDLDRAKAVSARNDFFQRASRSKAVLAGTHLWRLARLEPKGAGFAATPAP